LADSKFAYRNYRAELVDFSEFRDEKVDHLVSEPLLVETQNTRTA
jgi:hypothetical protein